MKTVIIYTTKNGVTQTCVEMLAPQLRGTETEVVCADGTNDAIVAAAAASADAVIIGGCIRMGKLFKPLRTLLAKHAQAWSEKTVGCFLCCGFADMAQNYYEKAFPAAMREKAVSGYFGGELKPEKLQGLDKWVVRVVRNSIINENNHPDAVSREEYTRVLPEIIPENIERFAGEINRKLYR